MPSSVNKAKKKKMEKKRTGENRKIDEQGKEKEKEKGEKITTSTPTRERKQDQAKNKLEKMTLASFM